MLFDTAHALTALIEKGYSDNPNDRGGPTNHGITEEVARANGYTGDMKDLSEEEARRIAKKQYWDIMRLDDIGVLSPVIATELFDTGFNCGQLTAGKFLQRALNALNRQTRDYGDLEVDGLIGPLTVMTLRKYLDKRKNDEGEKVMLRALNALQGTYYISISETRPKNEEFTFGWFRHRVAI